MSRIAKARALHPQPAAPAERDTVVHLSTASNTGGDSPYGLSALSGMCDDLAQTGSTGGRDVAFNNACMRVGVLIRDGDLTRGTAESALRAAGLALTDPSDFTAYKVEEKLRRVIDQGVASDYVIAKTPLEPVPTLTPYYPPDAPPVTAAGDVGVLDGTDWINPGTGEVLGTTKPPVLDAVERTSWWPRDLAGLLEGTVEEEASPAYLARGDGHRLFYAGKINALIGESESGKTWVGLLAVAQSLAVAEPVLYLDFEDTLAGITARLRALGATDQHLQHLTYISPDEHLDLPQKRDLSEALAARPPALILFDGVNAAMTLLGLDLEKNKDATAFSLQLLRPLKQTGAAVVTIDHVTKSKDNRGSYAIGAQAKRADIDGCALMVEVLQPFGRGMSGRLRLTVSKDRPGHVRAVSSGAKNAGTAHLDSQQDGTVRAHIEAPDLRPADERGPFRPTVLMERVSRYLEHLPAGSEGVSQRTIESAVTGNGKALRDAVAVLADEGHVERDVTSSGALRFRSLKPYSQDLDPLADQVRPPRPSASSLRPQTQVQGASPRPPSYRGTRDAPDTTPDDEPESWWQR